MRLIRELEALQEERGCLDAEALSALSARLRVPLYHLQALVSFYPHFRTHPAPPVTISVCRDMTCHLFGADGLASRIEAALESADLAVEEASCLGCCELAPAARIDGRPCRIDDVEAFAASVVEGGAEDANPSRGSWRIDPYDEAAAYGALRTALEEGSGARDRIVGELKASGLRGMGGAGFPTGLKWELVRAEEASPKYVVCNADESEPGTFKDRVIMEELPHLVVEGMVLGGLTVGAEKGIIYLRHEYGAALESLEAELARAREAGVLGRNALGSGLAFDIEIFLSPGGYILGDETALLEALEDKRGEPRNKPPFPGQVGLWGQPTLINNVETLALVPAIVLRGAEWWHAQGREGHAGLKCLAISGHVERPGVYELELGTTVAEAIDLAGGILGGRPLKAFAPGGASSNFLPPEHADAPIDFGSLEEVGSMMGSGALVVVADGTPMLPLAANIVAFFRNESCGKCVPCRVGTEKATRMLEESLATGGALDWPTIEKLELLLSETSICGLGYVALNPLLSIARHWPEEVPGAPARSGG